jgi:hypothetical protein
MDHDHYALAYVSDVGAMPYIELFRKLSAAELHEVRQDTACILGFLSTKNLLCSLELNLKDLETACETFL